MVTKVVTENDVDNVTIHINSANKLECITQGGGVDLNTLPEKQWEAGSKVVALDPQGNAYVVPQDIKFYKDVAVSLQLKSSEYVNDKTRSVLTVRVTNLKDFEIADVEFAFSTGSTIVNGEHTSQILTLAANETRAFEYVVEHENSTYVNATVFVVGDTESQNNSASLSIPAKTPASDSTVNNVFTDQCPMVSGYVVGYQDQPLIFRSQTDGLYQGYNQNTNVIKRANLKGLQIRFDKVSSVIVKADDPTGYDGTGWASLLYKRNADNTAIESSYIATMTSIRETVSLQHYSFDASTGLFTFNESYPYPYALIFIRTSNGDTCKYQSVWINATTLDSEVKETKDTYVVEGIPESNYRISPLESDGVDASSSIEYDGFNDFKVNYIGFGDMTGYRIVTDAYYFANQVRSGDVYYDYNTGQDEYVPITLNSRYRVDVKLPINTVHNFTIKGATYDVNETAGDITITHIGGGINVVTSDRVTATNNIIANRITISFV